jgi:hypothetical protein
MMRFGADAAGVRVLVRAHPLAQANRRNRLHARKKSETIRLFDGVFQQKKR